MLVKEDNGYLLKEETVLSYDLLENILTVRRKLQSNYYLILFFQQVNHKKVRFLLLKDTRYPL